jgi:hypothetical protein
MALINSQTALPRVKTQGDLLYILMNSGLMSVEISPGGKGLGAALAGKRPQLEVNRGLVTLEAVEVTQHLTALRALPALHLLQQRVGASRYRQICFMQNQVCCIQVLRYLTRLLINLKFF